MVLFFKTSTKSVIAVNAGPCVFSGRNKKIVLAIQRRSVLDNTEVDGWFVGPRKEMITPWSTNAVEITQNMGLCGIKRIEEYFPVKSEKANYDPMLQRIYNGLSQSVFEINKKPDPIVHIDDIETYNRQEGLALSNDEVAYLNNISKKIGRKLTDSEVFGFSQVTQNTADTKSSTVSLSSTVRRKKVLFSNSSRKHPNTIPTIWSLHTKTMSLLTKDLPSNSLHRISRQTRLFPNKRYQNGYFA